MSPRTGSHHSEPGWLPDGHGLDPRTLELVDVSRVPVHLRLTSPDGRSARGACDEGLGELWSGIAAEVNCRECLEVVHA